jgi:RNA polymerase sigma factor (sigma-70 family)
VARGQGEGSKRRAYQPAVEALEALRLLSAAAQTLPHLVAEHDLLSPSAPIGSDAPPTSDEAWDVALGQTELADLLGPSSSSSSTADAEEVAAGLSQLNRYLSRAWYRAGIPPQVHDDSTQAVFVTLLQNLGRSRFDDLAAEIGRVGIRDVLSQETADGPVFFRAIDTVKKRAQRERSFQPLDAVVAVASQSEDPLRDALQEAIEHKLSPREAALIYATLMGATPAEIAALWGIAPKTVSNEKTRALQKLRDVLVDDED